MMGLVKYQPSQVIGLMQCIIQPLQTTCLVTSSKFCAKTLILLTMLTISEGGGKLFKSLLVREAVRNQCLKVECKTYHAVDEQIIRSKAKYANIQQYNPKKPCKWEFKNMVRAGKSGFVYGFYLYCGKEDIPPADYDHLSAITQSVARLCSTLQVNMSSLITGLRPLTCYAT